jgi:hypothetical protein
VLDAAGRWRQAERDRRRGWRGIGGSHIGLSFGRFSPLSFCLRGGFLLLSSRAGLLSGRLLCLTLTHDFCHDFLLILSLEESGVREELIDIYGRAGAPDFVVKVVEWGKIRGRSLLGNHAVDNCGWLEFELLPGGGVGDTLGDSVVEQVLGTFGVGAIGFKREFLDCLGALVESVDAIVDGFDRVADFAEKIDRPGGQGGDLPENADHPDAGKDSDSLALGGFEEKVGDEIAVDGDQRTSREHSGSGGSLFETNREVVDRSCRI